MSQRVQIYDTTLRDGMQGEGMSLSADEKLRVAHAIDGLGVHFIEAGFLGSNPKDTEVFRMLERESFEHAQLAAFGMTRRRGVAASDDPALRELAESARRPGPPPRTTRAGAGPTPSPRLAPAPARCRAPSTATASAAATRT